MASDGNRIYSSKILTHPLAGGQAGLLRESGLIDSRSGMFKAWSQGLDDRKLWRWRDGRVATEYTNLIYDETNQAVISGANHGVNRSEVTYDLVDSPHLPTKRCRIPGSEITSLSLSSSRILLFTLFGADSAALFMDLSHIDNESTFERLSSRGCVLKHSPKVTYRASTAHPDPGLTSFAVAGSQNAFILKESQGRWTTEVGARDPDAPDVMAVDWLSPNVVIRGDSDGGVRLWDIRSHGESRANRIQHPSGINHVRRLDDNTIVVAGLESQLCTYDLRFPSDLTTSGQATRPYNRFHSYSNFNLGHSEAGFDVHSDLVAAVTDDGRIIMWDVKRCIELKQFTWRDRKTNGRGICVRFADGGNHGTGLRLLAAAGPAIHEFCWYMQDSILESH